MNWIKCSERREFATEAGECLPCHPECKVQEGKQTCTGPVGLVPCTAATYRQYCFCLVNLWLGFSYNSMFLHPWLEQGADECDACARLQDGPHCVSSCPEGVMGGEEIIFKYPNKQGHCEPCHANCTKGSADSIWRTSCLNQRQFCCFSAQMFLFGWFQVQWSRD